MLVLTRKENERILIGDDIQIVVTQIDGDKCRIGVIAPDHVQVDRKEIRVRRERDRDRDLGGEAGGA